MILLESENILIRDVLTDKFAHPSGVDQTLSDFDGVGYHLESTKSGPLTLSMEIRCWKQLEACGAMDILKRDYGSWIRPEVESGYNITLEFDYAQVPPEGRE